MSGRSNRLSQIFSGGPISNKSGSASETSLSPCRTLARFWKSLLIFEIGCQKINLKFLTFQTSLRQIGDHGLTER